jgi:SAM-dependent methyltransferase
MPVRDFSSGFRLYRRRALAPESYRCTGFDILEEILVRSYIAGSTIGEVPLHYEPRRAGESHARIAKLALLYLRTLKNLFFVRNSAPGCDYDDRAFNSWIPPQRYWQRRRFSIMRRFLAGPPGRVLDIGCGSSKIIQSMPDAVAFDLSTPKLRFLARTNKHRVRGSTFALPFADGSFDTAIHSQVIEHIAPDPNVFRELSRVLKPHGKLIIGTPDYGRPWWPIIERIYGIVMPWAYADEHITKYSKASLTEELKRHGFQVKETQYILSGEMNLLAQRND